jgi:hypothetical protein
MLVRKVFLRTIRRYIPEDRTLKSVEPVNIKFYKSPLIGFLGFICEWSSGQSSWLQIQRSGLDSRRYQIF